MARPGGAKPLIGDRLTWTKIGKSSYQATTPRGLYAIDGNGAGRMKWTVTYPDGDYGFTDSLGEAKAWADVHADV